MTTQNEAQRLMAQWGAGKVAPEAVQNRGLRARQRRSKPDAMPGAKLGHSPARWARFHARQTTAQIVVDHPERYLNSCQARDECISEMLTEQRQWRAA
jgi:hypothetical protein